MKLHRYTIFPMLALALLIAILIWQPVTAMQTNAQGQVIELTIEASGSQLPAHPMKVQVREGEVSTTTMHKPGNRHYQYMIRAQRLAPSNLRAAARHIASPLLISIRIDSSEDGKTWRLHSHANFTSTLGSTLGLEFSDMEKSTNLIVSSRLVPEVEHQMRKM